MGLGDLTQGVWVIHAFMV